MIIEDQDISIKITSKNIKHFIDCGYEDIKVGDTIIGKVTDLSKGSDTKVDVKCDYCGKIIKVNYSDYNRYKYDKYSCKKCRQKKTSEYSLSKRQDDLYNRALKVCNEKGYKLITDKSEIKTSETRILYECPKHGIHETKIYTLICGHGCKECSNENNHILSRKSPDEVFDEFAKYGGVLLNKEDYKGWNYKNLEVVCKECGEVFITSYCAFTHRNGQLCPKCASNMSRGEQKIKSYLENNGINFKMQHRFKNCKSKLTLPFDFFLLNMNICIEYDGEGHYIPISRDSSYDADVELTNIKKRDEIKTKYCKDNNIKLIRIPYWDYDHIESILDKELFT